MIADGLSYRQSGYLSRMDAVSEPTELVCAWKPNLSIRRYGATNLQIVNFLVLYRQSLLCRQLPERLSRTPTASQLSRLFIRQSHADQSDFELTLRLIENGTLFHESNSRLSTGRLKLIKLKTSIKVLNGIKLIVLG